MGHVKTKNWVRNGTCDSIVFDWKNNQPVLNVRIPFATFVQYIWSYPTVERFSSHTFCSYFCFLVLRNYFKTVLVEHTTLIKCKGGLDRTLIELIRSSWLFMFYRNSDNIRKLVELFSNPPVQVLSFKWAACYFYMADCCSSWCRA